MCLGKRSVCIAEYETQHIPVFGRLGTFDQVAPKSVLFHSPFPLRAPKNRILLLLGSMARRYAQHVMSRTILLVRICN